MEKTYSQKVARVFEIVDYFLLLPAGVGALVGFFALFGQPLYALLMYAVLGVGIGLLVGYFKHSRGTLDERYFSALWITTAVYNCILLLPCLYYASTLLQSGIFENGYSKGGSVTNFLFILAVVSGYFAVIIVSLKAYFFEKRKKIIDHQINIKSLTT